MSSIHKSFLEPFFIEMNKKFDKEWCVLHSYETLPNYSESDVDMAFSGTDIDALEALILEIAKNEGWTLYQKLWYDSEQCFYYVLKENEKDIELAIDFLIDRKGVGKYGFETTKLTADCNRWNEIVPIPNSSVAFSYKLVKRIVKQRDISLDKEYLTGHLEKADRGEVEEILKNQFGEQGLTLLNPYLKETNFLISEKDSTDLNNMKKKKGLEKFYWEKVRTLNRIMYPRGMIITTPKLEENDLVLFVEKLSEKVGLIFRFVKRNDSNSLAKNMKALIGSTLIINQEEKFNNSKAMKSHWLGSSNHAVLVTEESLVNMEILADIYYRAILDALLVRNRF